MTANVCGEGEARACPVRRGLRRLGPLAEVLLYFVLIAIAHALLSWRLFGAFRSLLGG